MRGHFWGQTTRKKRKVYFEMVILAIRRWSERESTRTSHVHLATPTKPEINWCAYLLKPFVGTARRRPRFSCSTYILPETGGVFFRQSIHRSAVLYMAVVLLGNKNRHYRTFIFLIF